VTVAFEKFNAANAQKPMSEGLLVVGWWWIVGMWVLGILVESVKDYYAELKV